MTCKLSVICRKFNKDMLAIISGALEQSNPLNINIIYMDTKTRADRGEICSIHSVVYYL